MFVSLALFFLKLSLLLNSSSNLLKSCLKFSLAYFVTFYMQILFYFPDCIYFSFFSLFLVCFVERKMSKNFPQNNLYIILENYSSKTEFSHCLLQHIKCKFYHHIRTSQLFLYQMNVGRLWIKKFTLCKLVGS